MMETGKTRVAFQPIMLQLGILVRDLEKAMQDYSSLFSIGPWETYDVKATGVRAATAALGPIEVELIQPASDESTIGKWFGDDAARINHLGFYIADTDTEVARFQQMGVEIIQRVRDLGVVSTLLNLRKRAGINVELLYRQPQARPGMQK